MSDEELFDDIIKDIFRRIERIENNIDYARFDIQEQRISELENRLSGSEKITSDSITQDKREISLLKNRINELEKNLNEIDDCDHGALQHFEKLIRTSQKEIAELRNHQKNTDILIREYEQAHNFQLNELKEEDEHIKHIVNVNRTGVSNLFTNYGELKEVLRELFKRMEYVCRKYPSPYDAFDKNLSVDFYVNLLEKLDGVGSARQMEDSPERVKQIKAMDRMITMDSGGEIKKARKAIKDVWGKKEKYNCESCKSTEFQCNGCKNGSKYSGGEKESLPSGSERDFDSNQKVDHLNNSKPPEQIYADFVEHYEGYWKKKYDEAISEFVKKLKNLGKVTRYDGCGYEEGNDVDYADIEEIIEYYEEKLK